MRQQLSYLSGLLVLWLEGEISFRTVRWAAREQPAAVAGRGGYYELSEP